MTNNKIGRLLGNENRPLISPRNPYATPLVVLPRGGSNRNIASPFGGRKGGGECVLFK